MRRFREFTLHLTIVSIVFLGLQPIAAIAQGAATTVRVQDLLTGLPVDITCGAQTAGPQGPVGPTGPQGPAGANGTNGIDAADYDVQTLTLPTDTPAPFTTLLLAGQVGHKIRLWPGAFKATPGVTAGTGTLEFWACDTSACDQPTDAQLDVADHVSAFRTPNITRDTPAGKSLFVKATGAWSVAKNSAFSFSMR